MIIELPILKNVVSIIEVTKVSEKFAFFTVKLNYSKSKLQESGSKKKTKVVHCGTECIDMKNKAIKEIGNYFFHNQET